jgi:hypothetical protein
MTFNRECADPPKPAADPHRAAAAAVERAVCRLYLLGLPDPALRRLRDALADVLPAEEVVILEPWEGPAEGEVILEPWP